MGLYEYLQGVANSNGMSSDSGAGDKGDSRLYGADAAGWSDGNPVWPQRDGQAGYGGMLGFLGSMGNGDETVGQGGGPSWRHGGASQATPWGMFPDSAHSTGAGSPVDPGLGYVAHGFPAGGFGRTECDIAGGMTGGYVGGVGTGEDTDALRGILQFSSLDSRFGNHLREDSSGDGGSPIPNSALTKDDSQEQHSAWCTHDANGVINSEIGIEPEIPLPDVVLGIDSPAGGVNATLPFGSGGPMTAGHSSGSYNVFLAPGVNAKFGLTSDPANDSMLGRASITTPLLGGGINQDLSTGSVRANIFGPQLNFPLWYGTNAYIGTRW